MTGVVTHVEHNTTISSANEQTETAGLAISLCDATTFDVERTTITTGMRVTVTYRMVGERRPVAEAVRTVGVGALR